MTISLMKSDGPTSICSDAEQLRGVQADLAQLIIVVDEPVSRAAETRTVGQHTGNPST
jgi:hypothetical protein